MGIQKNGKRQPQILMKKPPNLKSLANQIVGVQPMSSPTGQVFNMKSNENIHPDFRLGGRLSNPAMTRKYFPPEKKETFLNYVKLVHPSKLPQLLLNYVINVVDERWPEVEKYICEHPVYLHMYMKTFDLNLSDLNK